MMANMAQARAPRPTRPYRPPARAHFLGYLSVVVTLMAAAIMMPQGHLSWTWVFPFAASAATVYSGLRVARTTSIGQGLRWSLVQIGFAIGALCLLVLPARY
jgi:hypothetical protein